MIYGLLKPYLLNGNFAVKKITNKGLKRTWCAAILKSNKKIEYLQDNKGLIYWGKIKEIKDYKTSFRIDFEKKVWVEKKPYAVNVYLSKQLIENYRKRKAFLAEIKNAIDSERELYCFFYGVLPALKQVPSKKNPSTVHVNGVVDSGLIISGTYFALEQVSHERRWQTCPLMAGNRRGSVA